MGIVFVFEFFKGAVEISACAVLGETQVSEHDAQSLLTLGKQARFFLLRGFQVLRGAYAQARKLFLRVCRVVVRGIVVRLWVVGLLPLLQRGGPGVGDPVAAV